MKFELDQVIYYIENNKVMSAPVISRMLVENQRKLGAFHSAAQKELYMAFGEDGVFYKTIHGVFKEDRCHASKRDLAISIIGEESVDAGLSEKIDLFEETASN